MKRLSEKRDEIRVVRTNWRAHLKLIYCQADKKHHPTINLENIGIYHLVPDGQCSWYEFAKQIITKTTPAFDINNILPVDTDQYPTNAKRPKSSVLDNS